MLDIGAEAERKTFDDSLEVRELPPLRSGWSTSSHDRMQLTARYPPLNLVPESQQPVGERTQSGGSSKRSRLKYTRPC